MKKILKMVKKINKKQEYDEIYSVESINAIKSEIVCNLKKKSICIRKNVVDMIAKAKSGHIGGCFSACDLLVALYFYKMQISPTNPKWANRDRFILSKGHSAPLLYAILADLGYFKIQPGEILRKINSRLQGHPNMLLTPGIDMSSGSLGMGLSAGCGMAISAKVDNLSYKTYVMLGDGELQEGQIWEAVMTASHFKLDNLIALVDKNNLQTDSPVKAVKNSGDISNQFKAFGWNVYEIDGHDIMQIVNTLDGLNFRNKKPTVIIAETCKGKGVGIMEHNPFYHGAVVETEVQNLAQEELE